MLTKIKLTIKFIYNWNRLIFLVVHYHHRFNVRIRMEAHQDRFVMRVYDNDYPMFDDMSFIDAFAVDSLNPEWIYNKLQGDTKLYLDTIKRGNK